MATLLVPAAANAGVLAAGALSTPWQITLAAQVAGGYLDAYVIGPRLFGSDAEEGPRLSGVEIPEGLDGSPRYRCYGRRVKVPGTLVWRSRIRTIKDEQAAGSKGGPNTANIAYRSFVHLGYEICAGPINRVLKVWADGQVLYEAEPDTDESSTNITATLESSQVFGGNLNQRLRLTSDMLAGGPDLSVLLSGSLVEISGYPNVDPLGGDATLTSATINSLRVTSATGGTVNVDDTLRIEGFDTIFVAQAQTVVSPGIPTFIPVEPPPSPAQLAPLVSAGAPVEIRRGVGNNNGLWEVFTSQLDEAANESYVDLLSPDVEEYPFAASVSGDPIRVFQAQPTFRRSEVADIRFQLGTFDQEPDPLLVEFEAEGAGGADNVYAARGRAMGWFEDYEITTIGRPPTLEFLVEVVDSADIADVIEAIHLDRGFSRADIDVEAIRGTSTIEGYKIRGPQRGKQILQKIQVAKHVLARSDGGKLIYEDRKTLPVAFELDADAGDLATAPYESGGGTGDQDVPRPLERRGVDERFLPDSVIVRFDDPESEYTTRTKRKDAVVPVSFENSQVDLTNLVLDANEAQQLADALFAVSRGSRDVFSGTVSQKFLPFLRAGKKVRIRNALGRDWVVIMRDVIRGANMGLEFEARKEEIGALTQTTQAEAVQASVANNTRIPPPSVLWHAMDIQALRYQDAEQTGIYIGATNADRSIPDNGFFVYMEDGERWVRLETLTDSIVSGVAGAPTGPSSGLHHLTIERATTIRVTFDDPEVRLESVPVESMVKGRNRFLWGNEIIGAAVVQYVSPGVYDLSTLLRGLKDTDDEIGNHAAGDRVIWLDGPGVHFIPLELSAMESTRRFKVVANGGLLDDALARSVVLEGKSAKPFRVVNIAGERDGSDNLTIRWERQTRYDSQLFDTGEPLGEDGESYLVEITNGLGRSWTVNDAKEQLYTAAQQAADTIPPGAPVDVRIRQLSRRMHWGRPREATL